MLMFLLKKFQFKFGTFSANKLTKESLNLSHFLIPILHCRIMKYLEFDLLVTLKSIVKLESFCIGMAITILNCLCISYLKKIFFRTSF